MEKTVIGIEGMSCQGCVRNVSAVLQDLPGVAQVEVSLEDQRAEVTFDPVQVGLTQLREAIEGAGFDVV